MLNLKDITAMTFHLNENNNPEEKKTSLKLEINESFWLGNYDSKSRLLLYVTLDFLDGPYISVQTSEHQQQSQGCYERSLKRRLHQLALFQACKL